MVSACSILHVDDDAEIRLIVEMSLHLDQAFDVRSASGAEETLALLADGMFRPDLAMLDYSMGGVDGIALMHAIRDLPDRADLPVAFLTGRVMPQDRQRILAAGAIGVLAKPFNPMTLAQEIRDLLTRV